VSLEEAAMERRDGAEYDFNGELLETMLMQVAEINPKTTVDLVLLFVSPGRHAGPGGDIEQICQRLKSHYPDLNIRISPLVGQHAALLSILHDRLTAALRNRQASHSIKIPLDNPS
jgi:sirohydrochlorin ferrochelatase